MHIKNKHHFQLLEVMIAIFLIAVCALPILNGYHAMSQVQFESSRRNWRDHLAHLVYGRIMESLYKQTITWQDLVDGRQEKLEKLGQVEDLLQQLQRLSYTCEYQLTVDKSKKPLSEATPFILKLLIVLRDSSAKSSQEEPMVYSYIIYGEHGR